MKVGMIKEMARLSVLPMQIVDSNQRNTLQKQLTLNLLEEKRHSSVPKVKRLDSVPKVLSSLPELEKSTKNNYDSPYISDTEWGTPVINNEMSETQWDLSFQPQI